MTDSPSQPSEMKIAFSRRLQARMLEMGMSQSDLARAASRFLPEGKEMGRDNVSSYIRAVSIPNPLYAEALAKALRCKMDDLLPERAPPRVDSSVAPLDVRDIGDGFAWLRVNQRVPWPVAMAVMNAITERG